MKDRQPSRFTTSSRKSLDGAIVIGLRCRRDSTPLWPAGHLPRKGGDRQLRRRRCPKSASPA
ncbi:MAG: hypothetical protein EOS27_27660 [Mesorhizobium sp.]|nr:MAG: hypothetical protein EOS27_27660 [Mesorhizobium sp.]